MPKTLNEARDLAQSWIDSYLEHEADDTVVETLLDVSNEHCQILDNVVTMKWFRDTLADWILSHEGQKS